MRTNEITTQEYKLLKQYVEWLECHCATQVNTIIRQEKEIDYLIRVNEGLKFNMPELYIEDNKGLATRNN